MGELRWLLFIGGGVWIVDMMLRRWWDDEWTNDGISLVRDGLGLRFHFSTFLS